MKKDSSNMAEKVERYSMRLMFFTFNTKKAINKQFKIRLNRS